MIIDTLENSDLYVTLHPNFKKAFDYLKNTNFAILPSGRQEIEGDVIFAMVNKYDTNTPDVVQLEAHKKYIDVQYVYSGSETLGFLPLTKQTPSQAYDTENDFQLFEEKYDELTFKKGMFSILYPNDIHAPGLIDKTSEAVLKIVVKVLI
ncbi:MAG: YhcH/YjgK/YiaL family protein [Flavobacteriaceae bacterium]|nr:MAG: YhcH/YjgK/YiaL family protein [Flavobacteriaceae bacterium]